MHKQRKSPNCYIEDHGKTNGNKIRRDHYSKKSNTRTSVLIRQLSTT